MIRRFIPLRGYFIRVIMFGDLNDYNIWEGDISILSIVYLKI